MWVIVLEALVALTLLIIIVWLTLGSARRKELEDRACAAGKPPPGDTPKRG